ncbi:hypothetical protein GPL15_19345 [Clostridium sp. MCC353]|uniref:hypothetical protein n=1 Tax=Clostridium sp. MCC353 TaxID=2592646 RepID=UPI001C011BF3|nr:hypothetical protein [Clostridium sp. MCC353]MBT9778646.1 hypothetical protein [Clostridium sp. MCC353]
MHKTIFSITILLFTGISMLCLAWGAYGRYHCMTAHFPDRYRQVNIYEDPRDNSLDPTSLDKGKAIYKRRYVYGSTCYQVKISRKEFDEKFYICEDHPQKAYSESDLVQAAKNLVLAGIELAIAIGFFAMIAGGFRH